MAIAFTALPFKTDALEPFMSKKTLETHYGKHHKNYVDTLNQLISKMPLDDLGLEEIMRDTHEKQPKIFNNAAQVWNHEFFWKSLAPAMRPSHSLRSAFQKSFGSLEKFKDEFTEKAGAHFGSGWAWLVMDKDDQLQIRTLGNAENPLLLGETPLLTCDVWEHAYYLDYQNRRPEFLGGFWSIVNWDFVEEGITRLAGTEKTKDWMPVATIDPGLVSLF